MILDKMTAFKALEHYGIHVARTTYVDSAAGAIAFAERRNASDPRFMPIVLRAVSADAIDRPTLTAERPLQTETAIRRAYDELVHEVGTTDRRIVAQVATVHGTDIAIFGQTDEAHGKTIALHSATHAVQQMIPIEASAAETLVSNFEGYHHHGSREHVRRMLEHLLCKVSSFFEQTPVTSFELAVRLHENSYTVLDVSMTSPKALRLKARLDSRAHDRKGDEFHPSGRQ
jgi:hypothetical protein